MGYRLKVAVLDDFLIDAECQRSTTHQTLGGEPWATNQTRNKAHIETDPPMRNEFPKRRTSNSTFYYTYRDDPIAKGRHEKK